MTQTLTASGPCVLKAGTAHVSLPDADYTTLINQAEGEISTASRKDWVAIHATISANYVKILEGTASSLVAIYLIERSMDSYTSRIEAEDMINVNRDTALRNISILRDAKARDFLN